MVGFFLGQASQVSEKGIMVGKRRKTKQQDASSWKKFQMKATSNLRCQNKPNIELQNDVGNLQKPWIEFPSLFYPADRPPKIDNLRATLALYCDILDLCWAILELCWATLQPSWRQLEHTWQKYGKDKRSVASWRSPHRPKTPNLSRFTASADSIV